MILGVKAWRKARGISQAEMAELLNVHVNTYQNWENDPEKISISNAVEISKILNVPMNDIAFIKEA